MITLLGKLKCLKTVFLIQLPWFKQQLDTLLILSFTNKLIANGEPAPSTKAEIDMQAHEHTEVSTGLYPQKVSERFVDDVYSILKGTHFEIFFHQFNNIHQNIKFTKENESNG